MEAFSDGVLAIIITIMVLEMKVPHEATWDALKGILPVFLSYVLSFVFLGIYWNNHHHMLHTVEKVNGKILWANLHLLFWLSLIPFTTGFMGENDFAQITAAVYGINLLLAGIAYFVLERSIIKSHDADHMLARAVGRDYKGKASVIAYFVAVGICWFNHWLAIGIYIAVAVMWFAPDRRIESMMSD
ncbi:MAG: TMEM175 family protein [Fimbriimonadaceae bacterium]